MEKKEANCDCVTMLKAQLLQIVHMNDVIKAAMAREGEFNLTGEEEALSDLLRLQSTKREEVKPVLMELLDLMMHANIITVEFASRIHLRKDYMRVSWEPHSCYDNGNIYIAYEEEHCGVSGESPSLRDDGHPNVGCNATFERYTKQLYLATVESSQDQSYESWLCDQATSLKALFSEYQLISEKMKEEQKAAYRKAQEEREAKAGKSLLRVVDEAPVDDGLH